MRASLLCLCLALGCAGSDDDPGPMDAGVRDAGGGSMDAGAEKSCESTGLACEMSLDCCLGLDCVMGTCEPTTSGCALGMETCGDGTACCDGFECSATRACCVPPTRPCRGTPDCCAGLMCTGGACLPPPNCLDVTQSCTGDDDCCFRLACSDTTSSCCWDVGESYRFSELECCTGAGVDGMCIEPCGAPGDACTGPDDCCTADSVQCQTSVGRCCGGDGASCTRGADCCVSLVCTGGTCGAPVDCNDATESCGGTDVCCTGLSCQPRPGGAFCCWNDGQRFRFSEVECCSGAGRDGMCVPP